MPNAPSASITAPHGALAEDGSECRAPAPGSPNPRYSNRLVTDPSVNTSLIAWAMVGAIESTVSLSKTR